VERCNSRTQEIYKRNPLLRRKKKRHQEKRDQNFLYCQLFSGFGCFLWGFSLFGLCGYWVFFGLRGFYCILEGFIVFWVFFCILGVYYCFSGVWWGFYCTMGLMWVLGVVALGFLGFFMWDIGVFFCIVGGLLYLGFFCIMRGYFCTLGDWWGLLLYLGSHVGFGCCGFVVPCGFSWVSMWVSWFVPMYTSCVLGAPYAFFFFFLISIRGKW
jgi:hypothetical protein